MITIRRAADRGHSAHDWLDSHHTFSFADYYDPAQMGFGSLRVINDDRVQAGMGFGSHSHRDMEILSYVVEGALQHRDSTGTGAIIKPGDVQRMSAGTGVVHSEFNASSEASVHFLQIWLVPEKNGIKPSYEQKTFPTSEREGQLRLVAARDGRDGSVTVHADVALYAGTFEAGQTAALAVPAGRRVWVHVVRGSVRVNENDLVEGDGAALVGERALNIVGLEAGEVLVFDLA
jgi:redox-sensitive bicupin YhaK (pirin superfamily)